MIPNSSTDLVILLHGYLGSPFEMNRMASGLKAKGYSVLNDLIPGYGFSTGGTIIHKFLKTNPKLKAASVHLISPFFAPTLKFVSVLTDWFSVIKTEVSLKLLYYTTFGAKELKIMLMYPDYYLQDAPYLNMNEIVKSGKEVVDMTSTEKNRSPLTLYVTKKDLVMDFDVTTRLVSRDFVNPRLVDYSQTEAPHHLFRHEVSEVALKFEKTLLGAF
jgi:hypothetical protein